MSMMINKRVFEADQSDLSVIDLAMLFAESEIENRLTCFKLSYFEKQKIQHFLKHMKRQRKTNKKSQCLFIHLDENLLEILLAAIDFGVDTKFLYQYALDRAFCEHCDQRFKGNNAPSVDIYDRVMAITRPYWIALCTKNKTLSKLKKLYDSEPC